MTSLAKIALKVATGVLLASSLISSGCSDYVPYQRKPEILITCLNESGAGNSRSIYEWCLRREGFYKLIN